MECVEYFKHSAMCLRFVSPLFGPFRICINPFVLLELYKIHNYSEIANKCTVINKNHTNYKFYCVSNLFLMKLFLLFALLCIHCYFFIFVDSLASSQITCEPGETYLRMVEYLPLDTDQIDFEILSGDTTLFTRSSESSSSPPIIEKCLTSSTNNQYTIKLLPISGNSWPAGSYLTIFGKNNNAVFKLLWLHQLKNPMFFLCIMV